MNVKEDFSSLKSDYSYLDTAATALKPDVVLDAIQNFYTKHTANVHRGVHKQSVAATQAYEDARRIIARILNTESNQVVFTKNATESLNMLASGLSESFSQGDNVVITNIEHHSNFVPWQQHAKRVGAKLIVAPVYDADGYHADRILESINQRTKVVSVSYVSNALGLRQPIETLIKQIREKNPRAVIVIDGTQAVPHFAVDFTALDADFFVFSSHKAYGPMGVGILIGKPDALMSLPPYQFGGEMIKSVSEEATTWNDVPYCFEAGTPNAAGAVGAAEALNYLESQGFDAIESHESALLVYAKEQLELIEQVHILDVPQRVGVLSFTLENVHPHDAASIIDEAGAAVRAGHHCSEPLMRTLGIEGTIRLSVGVYSTKEAIDALVKGVKDALEVFR